VIALVAALLLSQAPPGRAEAQPGDAPPPRHEAVRTDPPREEEPPPPRTRARKRAPDEDAPGVEDLELLRELELLEMLDVLEEDAERPPGPPRRR
jgi:hypothetical protein